jgi:hypothetical protein
MSRKVKNLLPMIVALAILAAAAFALIGGRNSNPLPHHDLAAAAPSERPESARVPFPGEPRPTAPAVEDQSTVEQQWGIKIVGLGLAAAEYMIDFRFRVVDPQKAAPLLDRKNNPYIEDARGHRFLVPDTPKVGHLRQTTEAPTAGRIYWAFFANPGKTIKSGEKVKIVIGDFSAEDLTVQ